MVSAQGILTGFVVLILFSGVVFNALTFGTKCVASIGKDCGNFIKSIGGAIIAPDDKINSAVNGILELQKKSSLTDTDKAYAGYLKNNIYLGIVSLFIFIWILFRGILWVMRSQEHTTGGMLLILAVIMLILSIGQVAYTVTFENRVTIPFSGIFNLAFHPSVLSDLIDDTNILPGNLTTQQLVPSATPVSSQNLSLNGSTRSGY